MKTVLTLVASITALMMFTMVGSGCTSPKKKKTGPTSMFGYPYKGRHDQVRDAFGG